MMDEAFAERCRRIRLIPERRGRLMTDGSVLLLPDGGRSSPSTIRDGLGVVLAHARGSGPACSPAVPPDRRAPAPSWDDLRGARASPRQAAALREISCEGLTPPRSRTSRRRQRTFPPRLVEVGLSAAPATPPWNARPVLHGHRGERWPGACASSSSHLRARGDWRGPRRRVSRAFEREQGR